MNCITFGEKTVYKIYIGSRRLHQLVVDDDVFITKHDPNFEFRGTP